MSTILIGATKLHEKNVSEAIFKRFTLVLNIYGDYINDNPNVQLKLDFEEKFKFSIFTSINNENRLIDLYKNGRE